MTIKGLESLNKEQEDIFENTYKKHYEVYSLTGRKKYVRQNIVKVEWDREEETVNVYFENGTGGIIR